MPLGNILETTLVTASTQVLDFLALNSKWYRSTNISQQSNYTLAMMTICLQFVISNLLGTGHLRSSQVWDNYTTSYKSFSSSAMVSPTLFTSLLYKVTSRYSLLNTAWKRLGIPARVISTGTQLKRQKLYLDGPLVEPLCSNQWGHNQSSHPIAATLYRPPSFQTWS